MSRMMSAALFALACAASGYAMAQVPLSSRPMPVAGAASDPAEIHIDDRCRVLSQDRESPLAPYSRPQFRHDPDYCELTDRHASNFVVVTSERGVVSHTRIVTHEETFLLHNPMQRNVVFVVALPIREGWVLGADQDPSETTKVAQTYRIPARAGQTVRFHITAHD